MAYLLLALAAIFWGGNYVVGHLLVQSVDPFGLSLIRWGLTTLLMVALYRKTFISDLPRLRQRLGINALFALLGQVSFPLTLYIGLQYTSSLNAAIYISSTPCLVLLINAGLFRETISPRNVLGVAASTAGVLYLAFSSGHGSVQRFGWGDVLTIISALSWALYCAQLRFKDREVSNTSFVAFCSLLGTVMLLPLFLAHAALAESYRGVVYATSPAVIAGILYLVIFPSWLAYVFWSKGVSMIGTTRSEIFTHLIPVSGGLMGIVFLGNRLEVYHLITLGLIIFGLLDQKARACAEGAALTINQRYFL